MRQIISLSLPSETAEKIKQRSKARGHKSVSGYIHHLIELDNDLISESKLLRSIKSSRAEYKKGTTVVADSLLDLL